MRGCWCPVRSWAFFRGIDFTWIAVDSLLATCSWGPDVPYQWTQLCRRRATHDSSDETITMRTDIAIREKRIGSSDEDRADDTLRSVSEISVISDQSGVDDLATNAPPLSAASTTTPPTIKPSPPPPTDKDEHSPNLPEQTKAIREQPSPGVPQPERDDSTLRKVSEINVTSDPNLNEAVTTTESPPKTRDQGTRTDQQQLGQASGPIGSVSEVEIGGGATAKRTQCGNGEQTTEKKPS